MTQSTIKFYEKQEERQIPLVCIYQHCDGYIEGVGHELAEWLLTKRLVNGIPLNASKENIANGVGCLVAQYIRDFKEDVGGLYISAFNDEEEYNYEVYVDNYPYKINNPINELIEIVVKDWDGKEIFRGSPEELLKFKEDDDE